MSSINWNKGIKGCLSFYLIKKHDFYCVFFCNFKCFDYFFPRKNKQPLLEVTYSNNDRIEYYRIYKKNINIY
jgi:hypothetical protein